MAASKVKPLSVFKQPKFPVYQSLYNLNVAFQSIAQEIEQLKDVEVIPAAKLRLYTATAEDLRSAMNHYLMEVLLLREDKDWNRYGEELRKLQDRLRAKRK
ncbi:MAG TPA: hypothetical protein VI685_16125 [Candidatus Angelobacter sp.]